MTGMRSGSEGIFKIIGDALTGQGDVVSRADRLAFTHDVLSKPFYIAHNKVVDHFLRTGQAMLTQVKSHHKGMEAFWNYELKTLNAAVRHHFIHQVCPVRFDQGRAVHNPYPDNALA